MTGPISISDHSLKRNVRPLGPPVLVHGPTPPGTSSSVARWLQPCSWEWNQLAQSAFGLAVGSRGIGFIADDVAAKFGTTPHQNYVRRGPHGYLELNLQAILRSVVA